MQRRLRPVTVPPPVPPPPGVARGHRRRPPPAGQGHRRHPGGARRAGRPQRPAPRPLESPPDCPYCTDVLMMPAGGLLVAGAVLVTVAIVFVWRRRSAASIASLLAVLAGAV